MYGIVEVMGGGAVGQAADLNHFTLWGPRLANLYSTLSPQEPLNNPFESCLYNALHPIVQWHSLSKHETIHTISSSFRQYFFFHKTPKQMCKGTSYMATVICDLNLQNISPNTFGNIRRLKKENIET